MQFHWNSHWMSLIFHCSGIGSASGPWPGKWRKRTEKSAGHKSDFHPSPTPCLLAGCGGWRSQSSSITETRAANVRSRCKRETNYTAELRSPIHGRWFEWEQPVTELPGLSHCWGDLTSLMQLANGHLRFLILSRWLANWNLRNVKWQHRICLT